MQHSQETKKKELELGRRNWSYDVVWSEIRAAEASWKSHLSCRGLKKHWMAFSLPILPPFSTHAVALRSFLELEEVRRNRKRGDENYEFMDNGIEGNKLEVGFLDFCVAVNQQQLC